MGISAFACFAATAAAALVLRPTPEVQRHRPLLALSSAWVTAVDEASGDTYYYNEQTGEARWEPPEQTGGARVLWWDLVPTTGVHSTSFRIHPGGKQIIGRFQLIQPDPFLSREQCVVQVGRDGTATVKSIGKPPTMVRADTDAPWYGIEKDQEQPLVDGVQISLASPFSWSREVGWGHSLFTCRCHVEGADTGSDDVEYSEDGFWMWNGAEWVPAPESQ